MSNGITSTHAYADNGIYNVTLTVIDDSNAADTDTISVNILNANPLAEAGPDLVVEEGTDVFITFDGSATDPGADLLSYAWDYSYDGNNFSEEATGMSVNRLYPELDGPAEFVVALRIRDDDYPFPNTGGGEIGEDIDTRKLIIKNVPPKNVEANGPYLSEIGQPVLLIASPAQDVPGDTLTYAWDFDYDGASFGADAFGQTIFNTWGQPGLYEVGLRVTDEDGGESFDTALVNINAIPIADAGNPTGGLEGSLIAFNGSGSSDPDGDSLTYAWNFGDGSPIATGITVTHVFADNGIYTTTLTVRDEDNSTDTDTINVTVLNANPLANAGPDHIANEGVPLNLVGTATIDPGSGDVLTYAWDFDYDGTNFDEDAIGVSVNVTYPDGPSTYAVALRVRDDDYPFSTTGGGEIGEGTDILSVTVNNVPPSVNAGGPYLGLQGEPISLAGTAVDVISDTLTFEWDFDYDGLVFNTDIVGQAITNTWDVSGVYTTALRVTDEDGGVGLNTTLVKVNTVPTVSAGGPYNGDEGSPIILTGTGFDADGDSLSYAWDLDNDGTFETPGQVVNNIWADNGIYPVTLLVDDGWGGLVTDNTTVTVNNIPPSADAGGPYTTTAGISVTLIGNGVDVPADNLAYSWDLDNDGTFETPGQAVTYTQTVTGTYSVILQVNDDDGGVTTDLTTVQVN